MSRPISHYIEIVANLAIVGTCASVLVLAGSQFARTKKSSPLPAKSTNVLTEGDSLSREIVDPTFLAATRHTLLLYVKASCRFCTESIPFYERLTRDDRLQNQSRARVVLITADSVQTTSQFVKNSPLSLLPVVRIAPQAIISLRLPGTPAAVLVDSAGVVKKVWIGRLDDRAERDLVSALLSDD